VSEKLVPKGHETALAYGCQGLDLWQVFGAFGEVHAAEGDADGARGDEDNAVAIGAEFEGCFYYYRKD
jgi:hypothetical protein